MKLNNYVLYNPDIVIEDDERDPYVSWQHHLDRTEGQRGGVDLVALTPVPVYAPTNGVVEALPENGSAGNSMEFWHDANAGWRDVFSHLSEYVPSKYGGNWYRQGDIIAFTGDTGGVSPHLHRHLLDPDGVRQNPWDYFTNVNNPINQEDEEMARNSGMKQIHVTNNPDTSAPLLRAFFNESSGFFSAYSTNDSQYANNASSIWDVGPSVGVTIAMFNQIKTDCENVRAGK